MRPRVSKTSRNGPAITRRAQRRDIEVQVFKSGPVLAAQAYRLARLDLLSSLVSMGTKKCANFGKVKVYHLLHYCPSTLTL